MKLKGEPSLPKLRQNKMKRGMEAPKPKLNLKPKKASLGTAGKSQRGMKGVRPQKANLGMAGMPRQAPGMPKLPPAL